MHRQRLIINAASVWFMARRSVRWTASLKPKASSLFHSTLCRVFCFACATLCYRCCTLLVLSHACVCAYVHMARHDDILLFASNATVLITSKYPRWFEIFCSIWILIWVFHSHSLEIHIPHMLRVVYYKLCTILGRLMTRNVNEHLRSMSRTPSILSAPLYHYFCAKTSKNFFELWCFLCVSYYICTRWMTICFVISSLGGSFHWLRRNVTKFNRCSRKYWCDRATKAFFMLKIHLYLSIPTVSYHMHQGRTVLTEWLTTISQYNQSKSKPVRTHTIPQRLPSSRTTCNRNMTHSQVTLLVVARLNFHFTWYVIRAESNKTYSISLLQAFAFSIMFALTCVRRKYRTPKTRRRRIADSFTVEQFHFISLILL